MINPAAQEGQLGAQRSQASNPLYSFGKVLLLASPSELNHIYSRWLHTTEHAKHWPNASELGRLNQYLPRTCFHISAVIRFFTTMADFHCYLAVHGAHPTCFPFLCARTRQRPQTGIWSRVRVVCMIGRMRRC